MTTKYGMFLEHTYLRPGVPPVPGAEEEAGTGKAAAAEDAGPIDRDHGLNFKATAGRRGKGNDATFEKFKSLHEGDKFVDPSRTALQTMNESKKANTVELPFKTVSPMKKSVAAGDYYGTLGGKVPHHTDYVETKKKKGEVPEVPRGMYTSPAKKGSYGTIKTTISERMGPKGVATEYEYQHDPAFMHEQRRKAEHEAEVKARASDLPFKPSNPPKRGGFGVPNTTISKGKGVAGEWEYIPQAVPAPEGKREPTGPETPFRPSHTHAGERMNHIEYIHDPEVPKLEADRKKKLEESKRLASSGAWRPNMNKKTDMVRSIVKMNIPRV